MVFFDWFPNDAPASFKYSEQTPLLQDSLGIIFGKFVMYAYSANAVTIWTSFMRSEMGGTGGYVKEKCGMEIGGQCKRTRVPYLAPRESENTDRLGF